jgi:hypothetical protein
VAMGTDPNELYAICFRRQEMRTHLLDIFNKQRIARFPRARATRGTTPTCSKSRSADHQPPAAAHYECATTPRPTLPSRARRGRPPRKDMQRHTTPRPTHPTRHALTPPPELPDVEEPREPPDPPDPPDQ